MKYKILTFQQPIGDFVLTVMPVTDILNISYIDVREFDNVTLDSKGGPQREASATRINEISRYSETPDATFPTPILLALPENQYTISEDSIEITNAKVASVVDGQHRLLGLSKSKNVKDFVLPVVLLLDATEEQKALIFTIINGKQTRVSGSVIYDLFNVVEGRNPFKTAHEIARGLNSDELSPFYRRLKMLGKKTPGSTETLSQGTFITQLIKHISNHADEDFNRSRLGMPVLARPSCVLNRYFIEEKDEVIYKILFNIFTAVKQVFTKEWNNPDQYILSKTTGYTGVMKALPELYKRGRDKKELTFEFFYSVFIELGKLLSKEDLQFTSKDFSPNNSGESKLRDKILAALDEAFPPTSQLNLI